MWESLYSTGGLAGCKQGRTQAPCFPHGYCASSEQQKNFV